MCGGKRESSSELWKGICIGPGGRVWLIICGADEVRGLDLGVGVGAEMHPPLRAFSAPALRR